MRRDTTYLLAGMLILIITFIVGVVTGTWLARPAPTTRAPASPRATLTPDLAATVSALEERLNTLQSSSRNTPTPQTSLATSTPIPATPPHAPGGASPSPTPIPPTPIPTATLRVITLATPTSAPAQAQTIDANRAAEIARQYLGGGDVVETKQEQKHGTTVWEVKFRFGSEVYVDAMTGHIVYAEIAEADRTPPSPNDDAETTQPSDDDDEHHEEEHDDKKDDNESDNDHDDDHDDEEKDKKKDD